MKSFFVCPNHGDIYVDENPEDALSALKVKVLRDDVPAPVSDIKIVCPLCSRPMKIEIREIQRRTPG